jgi:hypothetical protein
MSALVVIDPTVLAISKNTFETRSLPGAFSGTAIMPFVCRANEEFTRVPLLTLLHGELKENDLRYKRRNKGIGHEGRYVLS